MEIVDIKKLKRHEQLIEMIRIAEANGLKVQGIFMPEGISRWIAMRDELNKIVYIFCVDSFMWYSE